MTSTSGTGFCPRRSFSALSSAKETARPFIFQLPAISGLFKLAPPLIATDSLKIWPNTVPCRASACYL